MTELILPSFSHRSVYCIHSWVCSSYQLKIALLRYKNYKPYLLFDYVLWRGNINLLNNHELQYSQYSLHFLHFVSASTTWSTRVVSLYRLLWFSRIFSGSPPLSALYKSRSRTILEKESEKYLGYLKIIGKNFSWCNPQKATRMPRELMTEHWLGRAKYTRSSSCNIPCNVPLLLIGWVWAWAPSETKSGSVN